MANENVWIVFRFCFNPCEASDGLEEVLVVSQVSSARGACWIAKQIQTRAADTRPIAYHVSQDSVQADDLLDAVWSTTNG